MSTGVTGKYISDLTVAQALESGDYILVETEEGTKIVPVAAIYGGVYDGIDLAEKFADEIADYDNVWAWVYARCAARNYTGMRAKDYIMWTLNGYTIKSQIAGLEPYYNATDVALGGHIDFISKDCYPETVQWNTSNVNQGNSTNPAPYMVSNLKTFLDNLAGDLPTELSNVILNKRSLMETRYTSGSTLTSSTSWAWNDLGKLWVPHEIEVHGYRNMSGPRAGGNPVHYEVFRDGREIVKGAGHGGARCAWWECDVMDGSSANACYVYIRGGASSNSASGSYRVPVCFRIGVEA